MKKYVTLFVISIENLKKPKISYLSEKKTFFSIICSKYTISIICSNVDKKIFKEEESTEILKFLI